MKALSPQSILHADDPPGVEANRQQLRLLSPSLLEVHLQAPDDYQHLGYEDFYAREDYRVARRPQRVFAAHSRVFL